MTRPRRVLVAGSAGPLGTELVAQLTRRGDVVSGADLSAERLAEVSAAVADHPGVFHGSVVNLQDPDEVTAWVQSAVDPETGHLDGLLHIVGGWRGGKVFTENTLADLDFLVAGQLRTLANTTLAAYDALLAGPAPRVAIVSQHSVSQPSAGGAAYAAAKAGAETWIRALADGFASAEHPDAAATVLSIKAILTPAMREAQPERTFPGFTEVADLAAELAGLWDRNAADLNGHVTRLGG